MKKTLKGMAMKDEKTTIKELQQKVQGFREERGWRDEDPKDMALSLVLEASELLEHFQWMSGEEVEKEKKLHGAIGEELVDVMWWVLEIADRFGIELSEAFVAKMAKQAKKYPVEVFNKEASEEDKRREYYKIKAATRGGHPLAEDG